MRVFSSSGLLVVVVDEQDLLVGLGTLQIGGTGPVVAKKLLAYIIENDVTLVVDIAIAIVEKVNSK